MIIDPSMKGVSYEGGGGRERAVQHESVSEHGYLDPLSSSLTNSLLTAPGLSK